MADGKTSPSGSALQLLAIVACGGILALQTRINGALGASLHDGFAAAATVFVIGTVIVAVATAVTPAGRNGIRVFFAELRTGRLPWWTLFGGAVGAVFVISQGLVAALLGTALFSIAVVAGQIVGGLIIDRVGLSVGGKRAITLQRLVGSILALVAVVWAVSAQVSDSFPTLSLILPVVAGLCVALQQTLNGRVRSATGSALVSTLINFVAGAIITVIAAILHLASTGTALTFPGTWWLYVGGITSLIFIGATAVLVQWTGVLLLGVGTTAGQLIVSLILDLALPEAGATAVGWTTVAGTVLAIIAAVVVSARRRPRAAAEPTDTATNQVATSGRN